MRENLMSLNSPILPFVDAFVCFETIERDNYFAVRKQSLVMQFDHYILSGFASRLQAADVRSFDGLLYILQEYEVENGSWNQSVVDL